MGKGLCPNARSRSAFNIDYKKMYEKGYRGIIFDIDNTLVFPNAPADDRVKELFIRLHDMGFKTVILSNNTGKRATEFAQQAGSAVVTGAIKPFPGRYFDAMNEIGTDKDNTFFVGDQIYTDIWGANNAGIYSILTDPLTDKEELWVRSKRPFEKPVIRKFNRKRQADNERH